MNRRLDIAEEEKISNPDAAATKTIHNEIQREKKLKRSKTLHSLWDKFKRPDTHVTGLTAFYTDFQ